VTGRADLVSSLSAGPAVSACAWPGIRR